MDVVIVVSIAVADVQVSKVTKNPRNYLMTRGGPVAEPIQKASSTHFEVLSAGFAAKK
jgi:uncharacterized MAPEG superfamily protein